MRRFLLLLVTRRWGWALIGLLILAGGILWGVSSPLIPYQNSLVTPASQQGYYIGVAEDGNIYIWTTEKDDPTFYVARQSDFNPPIDRTKIHLENRLNFVNRSDTISVNTTVAQNVHITQAHIIEQLILYDVSNNVISTYNASDYQADSSGALDNRWWPGGIAAIMPGLLVGYVALFVRRKKRGMAGPATPGWPFTDIPPYATAVAAKDAPGQPPVSSV